MRVLRSLCFIALLSACDSAPLPPADSGALDGGTDAGPPDGGPPLACARTTSLDAVLDDTVSVMIDTRMTETRPRDLGLTCGNTESALRWAPQEIIELHVPGTGLLAIDVDTVFPETTATFNTVIQVRRECETVPADFPPVCFDDAGAMEARTQGRFTVMGGETVYLFVTGYSEPPPETGQVDRGLVRLDVTLRANTAPTVTSGALVLALNDARITAQGNDPDGDARGIALNFLAADGSLLDIYGDGTASADDDVFIVRFNPAPTTPDYDGLATVLGTQVNLAAYLRGVRSPTARMRVFDSAFAMSEPFDAPILEATLVGWNEPCDTTHVCRPEMTCVGGTCGAAGPIGTACGAAIDLMIPPPAPDMASTITRTGTTGAGAGNVTVPTTCVAQANGSIGAETTYSLTIPDGTFDLSLTTDLMETDDTDTILYVRRECADSGTMLACNDDRAPMDFQSDIQLNNLTAGTYYVFVERYGGLQTGTIVHALRATLRAVLASGEACDPAGVQNRCAMGPCPAATPVCP